MCMYQMQKDVDIIWSAWLYLTLLYLTLLYLTLLYLTLLYLTLLYLTLLYFTLLYLTLPYTLLGSTLLDSTLLDFTQMLFVYRKFLSYFDNDHQLSTVPIFTYADFFWTSGSLFSWRNMSELFSSGFFQDTEPKPHPIHTIQITPHPRHATPNPIHAMPKPGHTAPRQLFFWTTHGMGPRLKIHWSDWYFILPPEQLCGPPPTYWKLWVQLTPTFEMLKLS